MKKSSTLLSFNFVAFSEYPNFNVFCFHKYINDVWCATYAKKNEFICIPRKLSCLWIINMYEKWSYLPKYIHILEKRRETIQGGILFLLIKKSIQNLSDISQKTVALTVPIRMTTTLSKYIVLEIKPCRLGSRIRDMEADLIYWWTFLTSMEAVRGQTPYSDHTL